MTPNNVIRAAVERSGKTQKELTKEMGMKNPSVFSNYLKSDIRTSTFIRVMEKLGYKIVVMPSSMPLPADKDLVLELTNESDFESK